MKQINLNQKNKTYMNISPNPILDLQYRNRNPIN